MKDTVPLTWDGLSKKEIEPVRNRSSKVRSSVNDFLSLTCVIHHGDVVPLDLLLQEPELALHLVAPADLVHELALERVGVGVQVAELHQAQLAQLRHASVGGLGLERDSGENDVRIICVLCHCVPQITFDTNYVISLHE